MLGLGTIINVGCILLGGIVGYAGKNQLKEQMRDTLLSITGVAVIVMGMGGTLAQMLSLSDGKLETTGTLMMILSLAIGAIFGELLRIEDRVTQFAEWLKDKSHNTSDTTFVDAFVSASCTVCIGAMAIVGAMQDGISGDYSMLAAKGILDAIIICIMTSTKGKGCVFSALPVGVLQGTVTIIAYFCGNFLPAASLDYLSYVGSVLILCIGLNLVREKQIKVVNALPALIVAAIWGYIGERIL
ncbi:MAG: DUF554 domain-containing protein [Eubacteriales bacterium]|nr:DUF554 domain-containing protein [Eubacteriales bacterium]